MHHSAQQTTLSTTHRRRCGLRMHDSAQTERITNNNHEQHSAINNTPRRCGLRMYDSAQRERTTNNNQQHSAINNTPTNNTPAGSECMTQRKQCMTQRKHSAPATNNTAPSTTYRRLCGLAERTRFSHAASTHTPCSVPAS
jgi:hypothetical protein